MISPQSRKSVLLLSPRYSLLDPPELWEAADKMRNNMDPAEYKHVVLGLIFLKYISDAFEEKYDQLKSENFADLIQSFQTLKI